MAMTAEQVQRRQRNRDLIMLGGLVSVFVGMTGAVSVWHALIVSGGIVLSVGLYGMSR